MFIRGARALFSQPCYQRTKISHNTEPTLTVTLQQTVMSSSVVFFLLLFSLLLYLGVGFEKEILKNLKCLPLDGPFPSADRVPHCDGAAPSLLHGLLLLDAGGRPSTLEQSGLRQHQRGQSDEALLRNRLG